MNYMSHEHLICNRGYQSSRSHYSFTDFNASQLGFPIIGPHFRVHYWTPSLDWLILANLIERIFQEFTSAIFSEYFCILSFLLSLDMEKIWINMKFLGHFPQTSIDQYYPMELSVLDLQCPILWLLVLISCFLLICFINFETQLLCAYAILLLFYDEFTFSSL